MNESLKYFLEQYRPRFEFCLQTILAAHRSELAEYNYLQTALDAIDYSTLNGGKRIRAMLVYMTVQSCQPAPPDVELQAPVNIIDIAAVAVELIHCYSLIHDDLPAMDDDALRRGQPTCHIQFGEANAILAGDALQAQAFELLSTHGDCSAELRVALIKTLSRASGIGGMVGGQAIDLASVDRSIELDELITMHRLKTGALISSAVTLGALCADADNRQIEALQHYARAIGLAFQIQDDIIDIEGDPAVTGKTQGTDIAANKPTFPALLGLNEAKARATALRDKAIASLDIMGQSADPLRELATYLVARQS